MVNRKHRIFCDKCGMPIQYVEGRRRVVWMEEHTCDPKRKLEWTVKKATNTQWGDKEGKIQEQRHSHPYGARNIVRGS
ncbi:hypothetical protein GOV11_04825 [Candidatus Woesearchaeota archaeon]|nr:hypothetical protein [Candidatus Woesearchaeota archaeon]